MQAATTPTQPDQPTTDPTDTKQSGDGAQLPLTGESDSATLMITGLFLIILSAALLVIRKRRQIHN